MFPQLICILLVMLTTISVTQARIKDSLFNMYEEDQTIIGKTGTELTAKTNIHCSMITEKCKTYKYNGTAQGNCLLIHRNSTAEDGELFGMDGNNFLYRKYSGKTWTPPPGWTGPDAALYRSFDNMIGLIYMEGTQQRNYTPLVAGKVNFAWNLNHTKSQWIDLGVHTEVCMTLPETCGEAGGAISLWLRVIGCDDAGIVSTVAWLHDYASGSVLDCYGNVLRFNIFVPDGLYTVSYRMDDPQPTDWIHVVGNYIGPYDGQGTRMFIDGTEVDSDTDKHGGPYPTGDGRIVVGRFHTNIDGWYHSVYVDELFFFNRSLSTEEIVQIYNVV